MNGSTTSVPPFHAAHQDRFEEAASPPHFQKTSADKQERTRTEPYLNDPAASPLAGDRHDDWRLHPSAYEERLARSSRPLSRMLLVVAVFIIGAAVGLAGAWWLNRNVFAPRMPVAPRVAIPAPNTSATVPTQGSQATVRGISPSELPYDGVPPSDAEQNISKEIPNEMATVAGSDSAARDDAAASGNSMPSSERASGITDGSETALAPAEKPVTEKPVAEKSIAEKPEQRESATAETASTSPPAIASTEADTKQLKAAKPTPKRRAVSKKDKEIERIKQQADDELRKKTESRRGIGTGAARSGALEEPRQVAVSSSKVTAMHVRLKRCERSSSLIRREECKWRLCNGMWGKNGCPSYAQPKKTVYSY